MRARHLAVRAALIGGILIGGTAAGQDDLAWIDAASLERRELQYRSEGMGRGTVRIELAIRIDADWEAIWEVLTACEVAPDYVPHVVACRRIDSIADGNAELFLQTVKPAFFLPRFEHVFRLDYSPPELIAVSHISGPLDRMEGHWRLVPQADGWILLLHRMTIKPGFPVPRLFVRNTLERDLPRVLEEIRRRAENPLPAGGD